MMLLVASSPISHAQSLSVASMSSGGGVAAGCSLQVMMLATLLLGDDEPIIIITRSKLFKWLI
jgi:hypothetical protein